MPGRLVAVLLTVLLSVPGPGVELAWADESWPARKCAFYAKAWTELLALLGRAGITEGFIKGNEAFIAAGCSNGADVCPISNGDIDLANQLTVAAMNFGTASSFLPFVCRQPK